MRLPALEKNVLIYRAIQMAQFLFYAESLKCQLVESVERSINKQSGQQIKGTKLLKEIFKRLEKEQLLSGAESTEIQELLEHRNKIAHHIHMLTGDIEIPGRNYRFKRYLKLKYDYEALEKLKKWHEILVERLDTKYILTISLDSLLFEAAEHAYEKELVRLKKQIQRQFLTRKNRQ